MRILLDHCLDWRIARLLPGHEVKTTRSMSWEVLKNGTLLTEAQQQFDVFLTVDQNIPYQQNMTERPIALLIIKAKNNSLKAVAKFAPDVLALLPTVLPGQVYIIEQQAEEASEASPQKQEQEQRSGNNGDPHTNF